LSSPGLKPLAKPPEMRSALRVNTPGRGVAGTRLAACKEVPLGGTASTWGAQTFGSLTQGCSPPGNPQHFYWFRTRVRRLLVGTPWASAGLDHCHVAVLQPWSLPLWEAGRPRGPLLGALTSTLKSCGFMQDNLYHSVLMICSSHFNQSFINS
jgi:hypothetical protein